MQLGPEQWQRLIAHRLARGVAQHQVCAAIGVKQPITISQWERGIYRPILSQFQGYLKAIGWQEPLEYELIPSKIEQRLAQDDSSRNARWREVSAYKLFEEFTPDELARLGPEVRLAPKAHEHKSFARHLPISTELLAFLGWYTAEGSLSLHQVSLNIGKKDERFIPELKAIVEQLFGERPRCYYHPENNGIKFYFQSVAAARLLQALGLATLAHQKKIPDLVFNLPSEFQLAFLEGYLLGDGTVGKTMLHLSTTSPRLKDGLLYLLGQFGLLATTTRHIPKITPETLIKTRHPYYTIALCGKRQLDDCFSIWYRHANATKLLEYLEQGRSKSPALLELGGELVGLEVVSVEPVAAEGAELYELALADGGVALCGSGGLAAGAASIGRAPLRVREARAAYLALAG